MIKILFHAKSKKELCLMKIRHSLTLMIYVLYFISFNYIAARNILEDKQVSFSDLIFISYIWN